MAQETDQNEETPEEPDDDARSDDDAIPVAGSPTVQEAVAHMRNQAEMARAILEYRIEIEICHAKQMHAKYEAYVTAGFSPDVALAIIQNRGLA